MTVGLVATYLVGHLGAASLAAVGLANQVDLVANAFFSAVGTGTTALVARHTGAQEPSAANRVLHQSILLAVVLGLAGATVAYTFAAPALSFLGARADVVQLGTTYLRIVAPALVASAVMLVGNAALRGAGDTRTPMVVMAAVNITNIVVASLFVYGAGPLPALGVPGAGLGAALGRTSGSLLVLLFLWKGKKGLRLSARSLRFDKPHLGRLVNVALPAGGEMLIMRFGQTAYAMIVASLGTAAYAAHQVVLSSESLSYMPGFGFAAAAATVVGQGLGARDPRRAEEGAKTALHLCLILMSMMAVFFFLCARPYLGVFTQDQEVIALGVWPLKIASLSQPFLATAMVLAGGLRGGGDTRWPMLVAIVGAWGVRIPLGTFLVHTSLGLTGAWITMNVDWLLRSALFLRRFRSGKWKSVRV